MRSAVCFNATGSARSCLLKAAAPFTLTILTATSSGTVSGDEVCRTGTPTRYRHDVTPEHRERCIDCHRGNVVGRIVRPVGRPNPHRPCSNRACHAQEFKQGLRCKPLRLSESMLCGSCHGLGARRTSDTRVPVVYPPFRQRGTSDFYLAKYDHKAHSELRDGGCSMCHGERGRGRAKALGHSTCSAPVCHGQDQLPVMIQCAGCHGLAQNRAVKARSSMQTHAFRVNDAFGHERHAKAAGAIECQRCHTKHAAPGQPQPLPKKPACAVCHDNGRKKAFAVAGAGCPRCHVRGRL